MANEAKQFTINGVTHDVMDVGARQLIADLQTTIDAITSGDTTTAIKTFQEVIDFLDGVTDDTTLIGKLNELRALINAKYTKPASGIPASDLEDGVIPDVSGFATNTEVNAKANSDDVYTKTEVDNKVANAGKVKTVSINGQTKTPDARGNVDLGTVKGEKGDKGDTGSVTVTDGVAQITIVNDLTTGGTGDALSAEMGKQLNARVEVMEEYAGGVKYTEDSTTIYVMSSGYVDTTPRISAQPTEINLSPSVGSTANKTIVIKGYNLTSPIAIALSDASGYYSIDKQTLPAEGGNVVLTYHPTAAGTHSASLLITSGNDADVAVGVKGIAATPTINVDKQSLSLKGESGTPVTASFHVTGVSLADVINVAVNGNGFSVAPSIISVSQAVNGIDVTVTFDGSADSGSATITLTSTGATSVQVTAEYAAISRLEVGDTITSYPGFVFTVLDGQETVSVKGSGSSGDVVIPSSVLDSNGLSYDVTTMDYKAFFGMSGITSVDVPSSIVMWLGGEGGYKGYSQAFFNCANLVSATLSLKGETRSNVFNGCTSLRNVTLRDDSDTIPDDSFVNCRALESLVIPDNVSVIGNGAFSRNGLKRIQIGTSDKCKCTTIGSAFYGGSSNGAMSLEYIICYSHSIPSAALYSRFAYGGGLPYGFRNYDSSDNAKGTNLDTNGSGRVYVPRSVLNDYRTNPTDGISSKANVFLRINNLNDSTGASGRIYAIEDIGTISGHEDDALLTD